MGKIIKTPLKSKWALNKVRKFVAHSNESHLHTITAQYLNYVPKQNVDIKFRNENGENTITISSVYYYQYTDLMARFEPEQYKLLNNDIGYIYAGKFNNEDAEVYMEEFRDTKGIIIDLRGYPADNINSLSYNYFTGGEIEFTLCRLPYELVPGFFYRYMMINYGYSDGNIRYIYQGKIVIIVDNNSISASEFSAIQFQSIPGAVVIGSQTAGADGNISRISLPCGRQTVISQLGVLYPDGTETQRVGVRIDKEVKPTRQGLREGRDELLEEAIRIIGG